MHTQYVYDEKNKEIETLCFIGLSNFITKQKLLRNMVIINCCIFLSFFRYLSLHISQWVEMWKENCKLLFYMFLCVSHLKKSHKAYFFNDSCIYLCIFSSMDLCYVKTNLCEYTTLCAYNDFHAFIADYTLRY